MLSADRLLIRPIELTDVPPLLDIIASSRNEYGVAGRGIELLEPADRALFATYQKQRTLYFVALSGADVVGGAGVAPLAGADPLTCELQRMVLRPEARGRGVGKLLLDACLQAARRFWFVRCYAEAVSRMDGALRLYTHNGFVELQASIGTTGQVHNDRWLVRALEAPQEAL